MAIVTARPQNLTTLSAADPTACLLVASSTLRSRKTTLELPVIVLFSVLPVMRSASSYKHTFTEIPAFITTTCHLTLVKSSQTLPLSCEIQGHEVHTDKYCLYNHRKKIRSLLTLPQDVAFRNFKYLDS